MLGKLSVQGCLSLWIIVRQGRIPVAVGAGRGCLDIFYVLYIFSFLSPPVLDGSI